jgi:hypothetical protein
MDMSANLLTSLGGAKNTYHRDCWSLLLAQTFRPVKLWIEGRGCGLVVIYAIEAEAEGAPEGSHRQPGLSFNQVVILETIVMTFAAFW